MIYPKFSHRHLAIVLLCLTLTLSALGAFFLIYLFNEVNQDAPSNSLHGKHMAHLVKNGEKNDFQQNASTEHANKLQSVLNTAAIDWANRNGKHKIIVNGKISNATSAQVLQQQQEPKKMSTEKPSSNSDNFDAIYIDDFERPITGASGNVKSYNFKVNDLKIIEEYKNTANVDNEMPQDYETTTVYNSLVDTEISKFRENGIRRKSSAKHNNQYKNNNRPLAARQIKAVHLHKAVNLDTLYDINNYYDDDDNEPQSGSGAGGVGIELSTEFEERNRNDELFENSKENDFDADTANFIKRINLNMSAKSSVKKSKDLSARNQQKSAFWYVIDKQPKSSKKNAEGQQQKRLKRKKQQHKSTQMASNTSIADDYFNNFRRPNLTTATRNNNQTGMLQLVIPTRTMEKTRKKSLLSAVDAAISVNIAADRVPTQDKVKSNLLGNTAWLETRTRRIIGNVKKSQEKSRQLLLCEDAGGGELCRMLFKGH